MDQLNKIQFTPTGMAEISQELAILKDTKLPAAIERVSRARDFGDLSVFGDFTAMFF